MTDEREDMREQLRRRLEYELDDLLIRAAGLGIVITVDYTRSHPQAKPRMIPEVRHARGYYPKEKQ